MLSPVDNSAKMAKGLLDDLYVNELLVKDFKEILRGFTEKLTDAVDKLTEKVNKLIDENSGLKKDIEEVKVQRAEDHRRIMHLENQLKRKNLVFKGLPTENSWSDAVRKVCESSLREPNVQVKGARKIYDRNGKMGVIAEFDSEGAVRSILSKTKNLAGSNVSVEKDLNSDRQQDKKALLQLKKEITAVDNTKRIKIRDDAMMIGERTWKWNDNKELMAGRQDGRDSLKDVYGNNILEVVRTLSYSNLLSKTNY